MDTRHWTDSQRERVALFVAQAFASKGKLANSKSMRALHLDTGLNREPIRKLVRAEPVDDSTIYLVEKGMGWQHGTLAIVAEGHNILFLHDKGVHPELVAFVEEMNRQRHDPRSA